MPVTQCAYCERSFSARKSDITRATRLARRMFCSRSCSAAIRNHEAGDPLLKQLLMLDLRPWIAAAIARGYRNARKNASQRKLEFSIPESEIFNLAKSCRSRCQMTGIRFALVDAMAPYERQPWAPSLDRIDRSRGYVAGNCRLICAIANIAMNTWGEGPLLTLADALVRQFEGSLPKEAA